MLLCYAYIIWKFTKVKEVSAIFATFYRRVCKSLFFSNVIILQEEPNRLTAVRV